MKTLENISQLIYVLCVHVERRGEDKKKSRRKREVEREVNFL